MKYLFCYSYQHATLGIAYGHATTTLPGELTEASMNTFQTQLAKQLGVGPSQIAFSSVVPLAA